jgi:hypothetical protein
VPDPSPPADALDRQAEALGPGGSLAPERDAEAYLGDVVTDAERTNVLLTRAPVATLTSSA